MNTTKITLGNGAYGYLSLAPRDDDRFGIKKGDHNDRARPAACVF
jgi:hypothetical protein